MATLQVRNKSYRVLFCYRGKRYTFTLGAVSRKEAELAVAGVDRILLRIEQRLIAVPPATDIVEFVRHDGRPQEVPTPSTEPVTFRRFKDRYLETHRNGAMEANSLATAKMHLNHFELSLGERFPVAGLTLFDLQRHVTGRAKKKYRGRPLSPVTLRKEVNSFRAAWNWAALTGAVKGAFPAKGLVYPKADEKPPFMTIPEIERKVVTGTSDGSRSDMWDCLYLTRTDIEEFLAFVRGAAAHGWIYPMICFAAHTGARRSEILRVLVSDVDLDGKTVLIREKKRSRKQRTTRRVPLSPFLAGVLQDWIAVHPGRDYLFCQQAEVTRSKKRSRTTGHQSGEGRATSLAGRAATVRRREQTGVLPLTKDEAHDHFKRTLAGSRWQVVPGWHCLRHSFISACASQGIDQRLIDEWTGHSTEEQRRRYRHLYPTTQQQAIQAVFG